MGVKKETQLQIRIQKYLMQKGAYVNKNWGSMICKPGIADLTVCYNGIYLAIEVKVDNNTPSREQGIHCREVLKAGGISLIAWSLDDVEKLIAIIDKYTDKTVICSNIERIVRIKYDMTLQNIKDGSEY